jgi:hypothetical protein
MQTYASTNPIAHMENFAIVFMKIKVDKVFSFSTYPIIWNTTNFTTFMHLESWAHNNALEEIFFQSINMG